MALPSSLAVRLAAVAFAAAACFSSSGCIFLGAYPYVQDVSGPIHGVRVLDAQSKQDIPGARATWNHEWGGINQFGNQPSFVDDREKLAKVGFLFESDTLRDGALQRGADGLFRVPKRIVPGVGVAALLFADGPGYIGPLGKAHGEMGYVAVVTAWADGYDPLQVRYHAPLFAPFECSGGNGEFVSASSSRWHGFDYDGKGTLRLYLRKSK